MASVLAAIPGFDSSGDPEEVKDKTKKWLYASLILQILILIVTVGLIVFFKCFDLPGYVLYLVYVNAVINVIVCILFAYFGLKKGDKWALYMFMVFLILELILMLVFWIWVLVVTYSKPAPKPKPTTTKKPPAGTNVIIITTTKKKKTKDPRDRIMIIAVTNMVCKLVLYLWMMLLGYRLWSVGNQQGQPDHHNMEAAPGAAAPQ